MAIHFILRIVLHLLQCGIYVASGFDMPSLLDIIMFELAFEIIKHCTVKNQAIPRSEIETQVSFDPSSMANASGIPLVRSIMIYRLCQALELEAMLDPSNDISPKMVQSKPKKEMKIQPTPVVYSFTLFKMCEALDLRVELHPENERPTFVRKIKQVPVVYSPTVFCICKALQLDAKLANNSDK
ncbi:hypothetical protein TNIN_80271 [Trichonephila inaurata madagascariensis]|uniref:Uncharacterized protein n=1 Tax=Trichonephila inaurata madagascariensis TaxID=2747483 RepID=A0A8X6WZW5_9ARAC|nr:hypothetical protein TNIN_80271 [Trichonephila inaurata madagascariensis]